MCKKVIVVLLFLIVLPTSEALSQIKCVDAEGEAIIVNNDIPSAKAEAIARAKWSAVEQVVGVEVKAQSVVQNMALVDDAVSKNIRGFVAGYKLLQQENRKDTMWVRINACIEPTKAKDAISSLALNNSVVVFIPAKKPGGIREEYEETNILSENLIGRLTEQGYTVVDVAPTHTLEAKEVENAIKSGNFLTLRSLVYKFLSNILLIGKIDYAISTKKGEGIGYGISMPFNNVTVRLTYRIIARDNTGKMVILTSGTEEGKGLAAGVEDAVASGMKELSQKMTPVILEKVSRYIKGVAKKVQVKVTGVSDMSTNFEVKEILQNIAWVTNVEDKGLGEFIVSYPENSVYLANSIGQKGNFKIIDFSPYSITVAYQR
ncbi:MAG: hypothetical protein QMD44_03015 [Thermodesulfovibrionales bacterium]|nr:hypothetical protein [Thermodesulfovibrionales bacterium]